ncbi:MAG: hypothetical protein CL927_09625 [Deltaproteobacteria bacterium]|nr:hypothetical protein [Deltaproteobacteria bacterium]HCH64864.1 hypothetical protein [Deltaproteobacteria bacterium]
MSDAQLPVTLVPVPPPEAEFQVRRSARWPVDGEKANRYHLPRQVETASPVGYRMRVSLTADEALQAQPLLALQAPTAFSVDAEPVREGELFEEVSLGVLSSRQSTNFRGYRQVTFGPKHSAQVAALLDRLQGREGAVLDHATHTHLVLGQPYRTPFTFLLTFVGHKSGSSLFTVPRRAYRKWRQHDVDIPTIGYLPHLHTGILADAMERAAVVASAGKRAANLLMSPFSGPELRGSNRSVIRELEELCRLSAEDRRRGWGLQLVAQVGQVADPFAIERPLARKLGANLLSFRSERIQPGVNMEDKAPGGYQVRQGMSVPDELAVMAGRAAFNAGVRWMGVEREAAKSMMVMERVDTLTAGGKGRLRQIRGELGEITDRLVDDLPLWADLPTGRLLSRNAARGRKAFALAGQRIYIGGLDRSDVAQKGVAWERAVRAAGAAASRSALTCELSGLIDLPETCDLLAGCCLMAGPVNQNDIGKQFYAYPDLLAGAHPGRDPVSLLVWTLKAKTIADPIGNEEQLLNPARKGALVDLRCGPHEAACVVDNEGNHRGMRKEGDRVNQERAFGDVGNFARAPDGSPIPGNEGAPWPGREAKLWV